MDYRKFYELLCKEVEKKIIEKADFDMELSSCSRLEAVDNAIFDFMYEIEDKIGRDIMFLFEYIMRDTWSEKVGDENPFIKELGK